MEKMSLYKFTHIPLLKNDALLKQKKKSDKKSNYPNLLGNKNHIQKKKARLKKKQKQKITEESKRGEKSNEACPKKKKKKKKRKKKEKEKGNFTYCPRRRKIK